MRCIVKFTKVHHKARLPTKNHDDMVGAYGEKIIGTADTGYDMYCCEETTIPAKGSNVVPVGLKLAYLQPGYWIKIESRSGLGFKHGLMCHPGIIDNAYRGDMGIKIYNLSDTDYKFLPGDKIAQLIAYPLIDMIVSEIDSVQDTHRGENGFGSSDNKG